MAYTNSITIFQAQLSQASLLRDLAEQSFRQAYAHDPDTVNMERYVQQNFQLTNILTNLENPQAQYLLLKVGDDYAGYALLRWDSTHELLQHTRSLMLNRIYFLQAFWQRGLGTMLLQHIIDFAKNTDYEWLWLVVWEENHQALHFYKKWEFEHFGYEKFKYGEKVGYDRAMRLKLK